MNSIGDFCDCICASIYWFKMVATELHWSFVFVFALPSGSDKIYAGSEDENKDLRHLIFFLEFLVTAASSVRHGEGKASSVGFDTQTVRKVMACTPFGEGLGVDTLRSWCST